MGLNEAEQGFKNLGSTTKRITFPTLQWETFEKDCKDNYNDTYYLKIMADHEYRQSMGSLTQLVVQDLITTRARCDDMELQLEALHGAINTLSNQTVNSEGKSSQKAPQKLRRAKTLG